MIDSERIEWTIIHSTYIENVRHDDYMLKVGKGTLLKSVVTVFQELGEMAVQTSVSVTYIPTHIDCPERVVAKVEPPLDTGIPLDVLVEILNDVNKFKTLTDKERDLIRLRCGLTNGRKHTLEQLSKLYGVTRERARQMEAKALRKLRGCYCRKNKEQASE